MPGIKKLPAVPGKNGLRIRGDELRKLLIQQIGSVSTQQDCTGWINIENETFPVEGKIAHRGEIKKICISSPGITGKFLFAGMS